MRLYDVKGNLVHKNLSKYIVDWDGKTRSSPQSKVKAFLSPFWKGHIVYEECPVYGTLLKVDILNATLRVAVEINGPQHESFHYFHQNSPAKYLKSFKNDVIKAEWLEKNKFKLIEIKSDEVDKLSKEFFKEKFGLEL